MVEKLPIIDPIMDFRIGETYNNDFIAEQLVTSKQGGIRVSTTHDHVVLFTNPLGEREAIYNRGSIGSFGIEAKGRGVVARGSRENISNDTQRNHFGEILDVSGDKGR